MAAREADIPIHVDHELSQRVSHIGKLEYRMEHAEKARDLATIQGSEDGP